MKKPILTIFFKKKNGDVSKYRSCSKRRILLKLRRVSGSECRFYKIRVRYKKGLKNETAWLSNKDETKSAIYAFTEKGL